MSCRLRVLLRDRSWNAEPHAGFMHDFARPKAPV
ncbi:hypothetical protein BKA14_002563 [Actinoplanes abujensis]|uniref:Uncharacterized protein n=1 Tax=Paractinoplanes abujensis TaxID=882441 RepID=A0A7W7CPL1_9ACTN|nr:hypothetical protein [Actinoplanes abujensis]